MTRSQFRSLAGGFGLKLEIMSQTTQFKRTFKSSDALVQLFWETTNEKPVSMAFQILANLARLTQYVLHKTQTDAKNPNALIKLYDDTYSAFLQFVEIL